MSSKRIRGVLFSAYPDDHWPMHVHARFAGMELVIDIDAMGKIRLSQRKDAVRPANAKASDIRRVLEIASRHSDELIDLWNEMRV